MLLLKVVYTHKILDIELAPLFLGHGSMDVGSEFKKGHDYGDNLFTSIQLTFVAE